MMIAAAGVVPPRRWCCLLSFGWSISGYGRQRRLGNAPINAGIQGAWMAGKLEPEANHGYPSAAGPRPAVCRFVRLVNLTMRGDAHLWW